MSSVPLSFTLPEPSPSADIAIDVEVDGQLHNDTAHTAAPLNHRTVTTDTEMAIEDQTAKTLNRNDSVNECVICLSNDATTSIQPCGHKIICGDCTDDVVSKISKCPICRVKIKQVKEQDGTIKTMSTKVMQSVLPFPLPDEEAPSSTRVMFGICVLMCLCAFVVVGPALGAAFVTPLVNANVGNASDPFLVGDVFHEILVLQLVFCGVIFAFLFAGFACFLLPESLLWICCVPFFAALPVAVYQVSIMYGIAQKFLWFSILGKSALMCLKPCVTCQNNDEDNTNNDNEDTGTSCVKFLLENGLNAASGVVVNQILLSAGAYTDPYGIGNATGALLALCRSDTLAMPLLPVLFPGVFV